MRIVLATVLLAARPPGPQLDERPDPLSPAVPCAAPLVRKLAGIYAQPVYLRKQWRPKMQLTFSIAWVLSVIKSGPMYTIR